MNVERIQNSTNYKSSLTGMSMFFLGTSAQVHKRPTFNYLLVLIIMFSDLNHQYGFNIFSSQSLISDYLKQTTLATLTYNFLIFPDLWNIPRSHSQGHVSHADTSHQVTNTFLW